MLEKKKLIEEISEAMEKVRSIKTIRNQFLTDEIVRAICENHNYTIMKILTNE